MYIYVFIDILYIYIYILLHYVLCSVPHWHDVTLFLIVRQIVLCYQHHVVSYYVLV